MKNLSHEELLKAPTEVQFLYLRAVAKEPVGSKMIEDAMRDHPEYFPDELEHRRKYALIPQSVHDSYMEEWSALQKEIYKDLPKSRGVLEWFDYPEEYAEWNRIWKICYDKAKPLEEALHKKYYSEYGI